MTMSCVAIASAWLPLLGLCAPSPAAETVEVTVEVTVQRDFTSGYSDLEKVVESRELPGNYAQAVRPDMYKLPGDRDPVDVTARRTETLLEEVARLRPGHDLSAEREQLRELKAEMEALRSDGKSPGRSEMERFRRLYWQITPQHPAVDFDRIVFIKRDKSGRSHMCDQFLGVHAKPGGRLYILSDIFNETSQLTDVLAGAVVSNGRLKGKRLDRGSLLSPDLSYDGRTIVFAYCECGKSDNKNRKGWGLETCFHLFRVDVDGRNLVQLTDGDLNDFDPCWLPNGRICFISERRGGYGRCHGGRDAPSYTLCSINPDGGDLVYLSYHESNEWQPSVTGDGQIVYTRWDYVDRGTNQAHHPWITSIDGRDARAIHGNYPKSSKGLRDRPWMEMDVMAIPGTQKFVATAAPHHGQAYGSLVILDPEVEDDDGHSQLKRLTPEAGYPESEGGRGGDFATAWPLSADFFLASYRGGIYLIDTFGGRQEIYRGKVSPCLSPIPLKARPLPPLAPHQTTVGYPPQDKAKRVPEDRRGTVALINAYDGLLPWPEGTKIRELRIIQIIPKATPRSRDCGTGRTNLREVVGTVPVERDGSAHFYAPENMGIYFQALDERGMAVQSMRSLTYVQPGQRLVCQGCHERRYRAPQQPAAVPLALRRSPSEIRPEPEGSRPFSAEVLVGPVFDAKCNGCHSRRKVAKMEPRALKRYVPYFVSPKPYEPSRTVPGRFGAMGSKLLKYLDRSHHDLDLTVEEFRRIVVWMDCNVADVGSQQLNDEERARLAEFAQGGER